jgi:hypothetical protein
VRTASTTERLPPSFGYGCMGKRNSAGRLSVGSLAELTQRRGGRRLATHAVSGWTIGNRQVALSPLHRKEKREWSQAPSGVSWRNLRAKRSRSKISPTWVRNSQAGAAAAVVARAVAPVAVAVRVVVAVAAVARVVAVAVVASQHHTGGVRGGGCGHGCSATGVTRDAPTGAQAWGT